MPGSETTFGGVVTRVPPSTEVRLVPVARGEFFSTYVPKLWDVGITVPDEELRWDEAANDWVWGNDGEWVDWDEFWTTVKGNGPMTQTRLLYRKAMWDVHAWVREAFDGIPAAA